MSREAPPRQPSPVSISSLSEGSDASIDGSIDDEYDSEEVDAFISQCVLDVNCGRCGALLSRRGQSTVMCADLGASLYSSDLPTENAVARASRRFPIDQCDCQVRLWGGNLITAFLNQLPRKHRQRTSPQAVTVICKMCTAAVGYHVTQACLACTHGASQPPQRVPLLLALPHPPTFTPVSPVRRS